MPDSTVLKAPISTAADAPGSKPPVAIIDPQPPTSPEVRALLNDVANKLKLSFAMAAAGHKPAEADATDKLFQSLIASRPAAARARAQARASSMLAGPAATRQNFFGRYGAVEASSFRGVDKASAGLTAMKVDGAKVRKALQAFGENETVITEAPPTAFAAKTRKLTIDLKKIRKLPQADPDVVAGAKFKKLGLFINAVQCLEETNEIGSDEIAMGGTATNPNGKTVKVGQFMIHDDFDKGEKKTYSGRGKLFHEWNLVTSNDWPHTYAAIMVMAEKDGGGFGDFLTDLWHKVDDEVKKAVAGAVGGAIGAALGSFFGPLGTAIGAAVGWLLGLLVDWILSLFEDDIVATRTVLLVLGAATKSYYDWAGLTANPANKFSMNFNGDGGRYRVWCSLSVYA